ncbi:MAG: molybdenum ABC transporter ATP-binding protein [Pseudomonadota bacterium]
MLQVAITIRRGDFQLEANIELTGSVAAVFGPSGSGKSTLLKAIAGLITPESGRIALGDRVMFDAATRTNVPVHQRRVGMVFQDARLFPHLSVRRNLTYGARGQGQASVTDVREMAAFLGLENKLDRKPAGLSGGEAQRVAIGRALLSKPDLLMLDEPLAGLDQARKHSVLSLLETLRTQWDIPIVYVSHARDEVVRIADTLVVVADGVASEAGTPETALMVAGPGPVTAVKARLVAKSALDGLSELSISGGRLFLPQVDAPLGSELTLEISARDVMLATVEPKGLSALNVLSGVITSVEDGGNHATRLVTVDLGGSLIKAELTDRSCRLMELSGGKPVFAIIKAAALGQPAGNVEKVEL